MLTTKQIIETKEIMESAEQKLCELLGFPVALTIEIEQTTKPSVDKVIQAVSTTTGISVLELTSDSRISAVVFARYYAFKLFKKYLKMSYPAMGAQFNRDHSTAISALKTFEDLYLTSKEFRQGFNDCEKAFIERIIP